MSALVAPVAAGTLLAISGLGLWRDRAARGGVLELGALVALAPLAWIVTTPASVTPLAAPLAVALVIALLSRQRDDALQSECALKLLWVLGPALALGAAGASLLTITTGTSRIEEQWGVLAYDNQSRLLWSTALSLSLLSGIVLLGGAPFHFWPADVLHGARPWLAGLAVAAIQTCGAVWLAWRIEGIDRLPEAARVARTLLGSGAAVALLVPAATLPFQRRPERRVGTLASLNGALVLASMSLSRGGAGPPASGALLWSTHLALALAGASVLAHFLPVSQREPQPGPALFRRNPLWGAVGLYALASLAGAPGTPGAMLWLGVARRLVASQQVALVMLLAVAWVAAFAAVARQAQEAFGTATPEPAPPVGVPVGARWAMLVSSLALVALWVVRAG